ncbi:MAG: PorP/SprF family type IX secretion system membrane protein [Bacteroidales bacterium]|nr:PorP/SprF family type IX secretion system membrane protein [Bacteroidales bacterium]
MRKQLLIISGIFWGVSMFAQQIPLSENYFLDKYSFAPSFAGNYNSKFLFLGYRSDWTGIDGGPKTFRLSYNDVLMQNAGVGGKIVFDKAGIFNQLFVSGSYSYNLTVSGEHHLLFGFSAGLYHNTINLYDYYNDPNYNLDPSLVQEDIKSKLKFMSDISMVYMIKGFEAGVMFSNISFGDASYKEVDLKYNPMANFQFHTTYMFNLSEAWDLTPLIIVRGGKHIKTQFEIASQIIWQKKIMGNLAFRDPGVIGLGFGAKISKGLILYYNFNFATNVALNTFNNHEVSLGFNIFEYIGKK